MKEFEEKLNDNWELTKINIKYLLNLKPQISKKEFENRFSNIMTSLSLCIYSNIQELEQENMIYEKMATNKER